jgi:hypothetical protein
MSEQFKSFLFNYNELKIPKNNLKDEECKDLGIYINLKITPRISPREKDKVLTPRGDKVLTPRNDKVLTPRGLTPRDLSPKVKNDKVGISNLDISGINYYNIGNSISDKGLEYMKENLNKNTSIIEFKLFSKI